MDVHFLSKGSCEQVSGGYLYNRYLIEYLRQAGVSLTYHANPNAISAAKPSIITIVDGLLLDPLDQSLVHVPGQLILLLHVAPDPPNPHSRERLRMLLHRSRIVVTGENTLGRLSDLLRSSDLDIVKIEPGVPTDWKSKARYADKARRLLGVTSYIPGKGICRLLRSLKDLQQFPWSLRLVGNRDFDPNYAAAVEEMADRFGLRGRIRLFGAVPHRTVNLLMLQADLLVHFSLNESYSMVTAEAIAAGLPTLSHKTGNYPHFRHSGLVSYVDCDRRSRTDALRTLISDSDAYTRLRKTQPYSQRTWSDVGSEFMSWLAKT